MEINNIGFRNMVVMEAHNMLGMFLLDNTSNLQKSGVGNMSTQLPSLQTLGLDLQNSEEMVEQSTSSLQLMVMEQSVLEGELVHWLTELDSLLRDYKTNSIIPISTKVLIKVLITKGLIKASIIKAIIQIKVSIIKVTTHINKVLISRVVTMVIMVITVITITNIIIDYFIDEEYNHLIILITYYSYFMQNNIQIVSEQEGFQFHDFQVINYLTNDISVDHSTKIPQGNQLLGGQRNIGKAFSIFNNIALIPYPAILQSNFRDKILQELSIEDTVMNTTENSQTLQEYFFEKRYQYRCVYNKFQSKIDYQGQIAAIYRNFDYYLDYSPDNYKEFKDKESSIVNDIEFNSNFQCGNLLYAFNVTQTNVYYLILQNDLNTHGFNQWFYFRIKNKERGRIKIIICNMQKFIPFFRKGMKISIFSIQSKKFLNKYWTKAGENIKYYRSNLIKKSKSGKKNYYFLEYDYEFEFRYDSVYFGLNIPYPYTRLLKLVKSVQCINQTGQSSIIIKKKILAFTIANNQLFVLQIKLASEKKNKMKAILFIGRQHPCETVSSFILEGFINSFKNPNYITRQLLDIYKVYMIPMVNPDGVIHGNSRVNICGVDVNRQWNSLNKNFSIQAVTISNYIQKLIEQVEIEYVFDFHGHSKKLNTFCYFSDSKPQTKAFGYSLSEANQIFDFDSFIFQISKDKQNTFRNFIFNKKIRNSITVQTSYYGKIERGKFQCFNTRDLESIAESIIDLILKFQNPEKKAKLIANYLKIQKQRAFQKKLNYCENSESDPQGDYLQDYERKVISIQKDKKSQISTPMRRREQKSLSLIQKPPIHNMNSIFKLQKTNSKTKNLRYSSMYKTKTETNEQNLSKTTNSIYSKLKPKIINAEKRILKTQINEIDLKIEIQRPFSQIQRKSVSRIIYPTSIQPYFQRFKKNQNLKLEPSLDNFKQQEQIIPFSSFMKFPRKQKHIKSIQESSNRENVSNKMSKNASLLKKVINISSIKHLQKN